VTKQGRAPGGRQWPPSLPVPVTGLVGREREVVEVARLVADDRLVTLVGSGGVGKTRLAIEVAAAVAPRFGYGTVLADLRGVTGKALVWAAVAQAAGVEEQAGAELAERIAAVLQPQNLLLGRVSQVDPRAIADGRPCLLNRAVAMTRLPVSTVIVS
jgi:hypothetical protein